MSEMIKIDQSVAILVDGNNIERSIHTEVGHDGTMVNFDTLIPKLLGNRGLNRLIYFREGKNISSKLAERLHDNYHGSVRPCHKSADIPLSIKATQLSNKVDSIMDADTKINLEDYGRVLESGWGKDPSEELKQVMRDKYDFDPDTMLNG